MRSPRSILGVSEHAPLSECKRSYRRLVSRLHPDVNPDPQAHELCKTVINAWMELDGRYPARNPNPQPPPPRSYGRPTSTAMARPMGYYGPPPTQVARHRTPVSPRYWRDQDELEAIHGHLGTWQRDGLRHYTLAELLSW